MKITNFIVTILLIMGLLVAPGLVMAEDCTAKTFDSGISKFSSSENLNPLVKGSSKGGSSSSSSKYVKKADWDDDDDTGDEGGSFPFWAIILIVIIILLIVVAVVYFAFIKK